MPPLEKKSVTRTFATTPANDRYLRRLARQLKVTPSAAVHALLESARIGAENPTLTAEMSEMPIIATPKRRSTDTAA